MTTYEILTLIFTAMGPVTSVLIHYKEKSSQSSQSPATNSDKAT